MKFTELDLHPDIQKGIEEAGFIDCTEVQEKTFVTTLSGGDVAVQSQTGTGKTAAFLISIFQLFITDKVENKRALVIVPTRELAVQIEKEANVLGQFLPITVGSFYGGVGYGKQEELLRDNVNIAIGTPGRLIDFSSSGKLNLREFGVLVIDEADRLFDMGFLPDLRRIVKKLPRAHERISMLFSATLSSRVHHLAWEHMHDPVEIEISPENITVEEVTQELYHVPRADKFSLLLGIIAKENPDGTLIFTNTKNSAVEIAERLKHNGYPSRYIIGDLPQKKRLRVIEEMKAGSLKFLVATDVAARGLHIQELELVVNYDLPEDMESYVHRIGRTARAGKTGKAVSLACERFVYSLEAIEEYIDMKIPVAWAEDDMFVADKSPHINVHRLRNDEGAAGEDRGRRNEGQRSGQRGGQRGGQRDGQRGGQRGAQRGGQRGGQKSGQRGQAPSRQGPKRQQNAGGPQRGAAASAAASVAHAKQELPRSGGQGGRNRSGQGGGQRGAQRGGQRGARPVNTGNPESRRPAPNSKHTPNKDGGRPARRPAGRPTTRPTQPRDTKSNADLESRLAYYREKYGEDFKPTAKDTDSPSTARNKKSVFSRLFGNKKSKR